MSENGLAGLGCNLIVPDEDKKDLKVIEKINISDFQSLIHFNH